MTALQMLQEPYFPQMPLGPWTVDFFLPVRNIVLECDGKYWHAIPRVEKRDRKKDGWLQWKHGYTVRRLTEDAIRTNALACVSL